MKYYFLFLVLLVLIGVKGNSQTHYPFMIINPTQQVFIFGFGGSHIVTWTDKSDTIEINLPLKIHFIKIGNEVYEIKEHNPTIELSQPSVRLWQPGIIQFYDSVWRPSPLLTTPNIPLNSKP